MYHSQLKALSPILLAIYGATLLVLATVVILKWQAQVSIMVLMRDPSATMEVPFYTGLVSNLGILLWCATAAICLFSALVLRRLANHSEKSSFLLTIGFLTLALTLDDLFLLHERVFPDYLNISEKLVYIAYGLTSLICCLRFKQLILKTDFILLLFAVGFFGFSIVIDRLLPFSEPAILIEDGAKLLGIVSWLAYFTRTCLQSIRRGVLRSANYCVRQDNSLASSYDLP